jgi:flagellar hook-associated protein 3 FlgL
MRITDTATFDRIKNDVLKARDAVNVAQGQASSGLRVSKPSDDPAAASAARRETSRKALADAGKAAADSATTVLQSADDALNDVYEGLSGVRDLATQNASSTVSAEDRRAAASQVRSIRDQMVALGNTNVAGSYVFAGYKDKTPAYNTDGTYAGDNSSKEVQARPGLKVGTSIPGSRIFGDEGADDNMFSTLDQLATALDNNDQDAVKNMLTSLDKNQERVISARSQVGSMMNTVTVASSVAERNGFNAQVEYTRLVGIDAVSSTTNLLQAKNALDSALTIAQQIPTSGLLGGK